MGDRIGIGSVIEMACQYSVLGMRCHVTSLWSLTGICLVGHWLHACDEVVIMALVVLPVNTGDNQI